MQVVSGILWPATAVWTVAADVKKYKEPMNDPLLT